MTTAVRSRYTKADLQAEVERLRARVGELEAELAARQGGSDEGLAGLLTEAIESIAEGVAFYDQDDRFIVGNESYRKMMEGFSDRLKPGVNFEQVARWRAETGLVPNAVGRVDEWVKERVDRHRQPGHSFVRYRSSDDRWILATEHQTRAGGTVIIRTDITDRMKAEQALRDSEERFRSVFQMTNVGMMMRSLDRTTRMANPALCKMLGYQPGELDDVPLRTLMVPEDRERGLRLRDQVAAGDVELAAFEERFIHKDGHIVWFQTSHSPIYDAGGTLKYIFTIRQDITARMGAEEALRDSEERFRTVFERTRAGMLLSSLDGAVRMINPALCEMLGYTAQELATIRMSDLVHPEDRQKALDLRAQVISGAADSATGPERFIRRDGKIVWFHTLHSPIHDTAGKLRYIFTVRQDITDRMLAEEALRDSEQRFRTVFETTGVSMVLASLDGSVRMMNSATCDLVGYSRAELEHISLSDLIHPEDKSKRVRTTSRIAGGQREPWTREERFIRKDGSIIWSETTHSPIYDADGKMVYIFIIRRDITERKRAEEALRASEERFRGAFDNTGVGIMLMSMDGKTRRFNQALCELFGYSEEELGGMRVRDIAHPDDDPRHTSLRYVDFSQGHSPNLMRRFIRKDGRVVHACVSHSVVRDAEGNPLNTVSIYQDVSEQIRAQESLKYSEEKFRNLIEGSIQGVLIHRDFKPLFVNQAYADIFGFKNPQEVIDAGDCLEHFAPQERKRVEEYAAARLQQRPAPLTYEVQAIDKNGNMIWLENRASIVNWDGVTAILRIVVNITERKHIEQQLRQIQKMEAIGHLTGGLAHDFNNLLSVIMINVQLVADRIRTDATASELIGAAMNATMRGAELTKRLLAFSRQQILEPETINIDVVVSEMGSLLRRTIGESIEVEIIRSEGLWPAKVDRTQLESALLNLALNSRDAMPNGGALTIETSNVQIDDSYSAVNAGIAPGEYVMLAVSDNGVGMSREVLQCAFEPFFSTKEVGAGTGLGLSMIYGFVKQSNGYIKLYSEEARGTTAKIYFPRDEQPERVERERRDSEGAVPRGGECVLVVEDQADVRSSIAVLLSDLGYRILEADNGSSALNVLKQNPKVDLILTDVVMPGPVDGPALAQIARERYPKIRVLLMSGYTYRVISREKRLENGVEVIVKPFQNRDLANKIREVLDR